MSHPTQLLHIPDTQSESDGRHLAIQRVGVRRLRYPLALRVGAETQSTAALWSLDVALPAHRKGTHMSRFIAWLDDLACDAPPMEAVDLWRAQRDMLNRLDASEGRVEVAFRFFLRKRAPVSGLSSLMDYEGRWIVETRGDRTRLWSEVMVPVKSLCPCSKEIADYGAHNQRSHVTLCVELLDPVHRVVSWPELVRYAEDAASCELWPLLKRADEKWVTEHAYENPRFVEDLVREVALRLNADDRLGAYTVDIENFESIHNHSACARIERA